MKRRMGFVANSSSASYTITIETDKRTFYSKLAKHLDWPYDASFTQKVDKQIKVMQYLLKMKNPIGNSKKHYAIQLEYYNKMKTELKDLDFNTEGRIRYYQLMFEFHNILCEVTSDGHISLSENTSMHNDFNEGMSNLMKEILLSFMFETEIPVNAEVEHD